MSSLRWPVVIFDLNGTLAATVPLLIASYENAWRTVLGTEPDLQDARVWLGMPTRDAFALAAPEERLDDLVGEFVRFENEHMVSLVRPLEPVVRAVRAITAEADLVGVVTSKPHRSAASTLECAGLSGLPILSAKEDVASAKPAPDSLRHALAGLDRDPAEVVHVCDSPQDVAAARAAGIACVAVTWGASLRAPLEAAGPDAVVDDGPGLVASLTAA